MTPSDTPHSHGCAFITYGRAFECTCASIAMNESSGSKPESEEELETEWDIMLGVSDAPTKPIPLRESTRVLNQDEIDSLLGFDENDKPLEQRSFWVKLKLAEVGFMFRPFSWTFAANRQWYGGRWILFAGPFILYIDIPWTRHPEIYD